MLTNWSLMTVLVQSILCFNLDVRDEGVIREGVVRSQNSQINSPNGSYFGYSLALHLPKNSKEGQRLLVGSPGYNQFRGAVQVCKKADSELYKFTCEMAKSPANNNLTPNSWLGATVITDGSLGLALACAPRTDVAEGTCYYTKNKFDDSSRYRLTQPNAHKLCQFGFSAVFAAGKSKLFKLFTSAPSCEMIWDGKTREYVETSSVFFTENAEDLQKTSKWTEMERYYKGYAMATDGQKLLVASVGFHVDTGYAGKVYVTGVDTNQIIAEIKGHQSGEHFGASLAVTDVNNDGRDDIIIGAPHHTDYEHPELKYEIGAVYVYLQTDSGGFEKNSSNEPMKGQTTGGRFGYAVAGLGDTNFDGYNDVAVGAPYENEYGNIYIYHGSKTGLKTQPAQIISGNSFKPPISSFGFSFSSTKSDFDENKYYDVFVGAYQSSAVVYLPARPIVRVSADFTFLEENLALNKKNSDCILPTSRLPGSESLEIACTDVKFCIAYSGEGIQEMGFNIKINLDVLIDDLESRRLLFLENHEHFIDKNITGLTNNNNQRCLTSKVYGKSNVTNIVTLVQGKMTVELLIPRSQQPDIIRQLMPILDVDTINFHSNFMSLSDPDIGNNNSVPWWVYVAAILGALLFLGLIAAILYKLGFFKRKLPPSADQQQQETLNVTEEPQQTNQ